ncbi:MAG: UDP-N-acetylmuramate--alanine ligase [Alphaproteobacteria bacterium]|nr:UDP-N-acetylmuramate--alanine ligase [Alphaproteobacteria bacterium]
MKYYFCGIGGIGMSSIAQYVRLKGHDVAGSDRAFDLGDNESMRRKLENLGVRIFPQNGSAVTVDTDIFVVSTAVESQIPDVKRARELGLKIQKRAEILAEILHTHTGIAIAGTSGKTTITAMVGHILTTCGLSPIVINGGIFINTYDVSQEPSNFLMGQKDFCVVEADESDGSIELYHPAISVISNISLDHKSLTELRPLFRDFVKRTEKGVILNADCDETRALVGIHPQTLTFSCRPDQAADLKATDIIPTDSGIDFKVNGISTHLQVLGKHNVENALAAIGAALLAGVPVEQAVQALSSFLGTKRRLEKIGVARGITVYDDYAHNPEKVAASLCTLHQENHALYVIFQPHGFAPTRLMKEGYVEAFSRYTGPKDVLLFPEIFYQGGTVVKDISAQDLVEDLIVRGKQAFFFENRAAIPAFVAERIQPGDRVVVMGARDCTLTDLAKDILKSI